MLLLGCGYSSQLAEAKQIWLFVPISGYGQVIVAMGMTFSLVYLTPDLSLLASHFCFPDSKNRSLCITAS